MKIEIYANLKMIAIHLNNFVSPVFYLYFIRVGTKYSNVSEANASFLLHFFVIAFSHNFPKPVIALADI